MGATGPFSGGCQCGAVRFRVVELGRGRSDGALGVADIGFDLGQLLAPLTAALHLRDQALLQLKAEAAALRA